MVSRLFVQYSTYLLSMDLCGIDVLNENILPVESKKEYLNEKQQVSLNQFFVVDVLQNEERLLQQNLSFLVNIFYKENIKFKFFELSFVKTFCQCFEDL